MVNKKKPYLFLLAFILFIVSFLFILFRQQFIEWIFSRFGSEPTSISQSPSTTTSQIIPEKTYNNPFDQKNQFVNPFDQYQNPFITQ